MTENTSVSHYVGSVEQSEFKESMLEKIRDEDERSLSEFLKQSHPADIAEVLEDLDLPAQKRILKLLSLEMAAEVLGEVDPYSEEALLKNLDHMILVDILAEMSQDDAIDILGEMEPAQAQKLLRMMHKDDSDALLKLLRYHPETAGGLMTSEYVAIPNNCTVEQALELVRTSGREAESIFYVYVIDEIGCLQGVVSIRSLVLADPKNMVRDTINPLLVAVRYDTDQEEVASLVAKYNLLALPVVDEDNHLLGMVTVDDVLDVMEEEATEDMLRMAGVAQHEIGEMSPIKTAAHRLGWLFITMIAGLLSATVLDFFESTIHKVVALVLFLPVIIGLAGNAGIQSVTVVNRGMALGEVDKEEEVGIFMRELKAGLLLGVACALIMGGIAWVWQGNSVDTPYLLGVIVGVSMFLTITMAVSMGTVAPLVLRRFGVDPAIASGPFVTTSIDIVGLVLYFSIATICLSYL